MTASAFSWRPGSRVQAVMVSARPADGILREVRTEVRSGAALGELLAAAKQSGCDVLVVGARGARGGVERALLGSVAAGVLNRSPRPVMVVR